MMKKAIAVVCCLFWTAAFAQNIPADSLDTYPNFHSYQGALPLLVGIGVSVGRPL